jgi:hypothetical protein
VRSEESSEEETAAGMRKPPAVGSMIKVDATMAHKLARKKKAAKPKPKVCRSVELTVVLSVSLCLLRTVLPTQQLLMRLHCPVLLSLPMCSGVTRPTGPSACTQWHIGVRIGGEAEEGEEGTTLADTATARSARAHVPPCFCPPVPSLPQQPAAAAAAATDADASTRGSRTSRRAKGGH